MINTTKLGINGKITDSTGEIWYNIRIYTPELRRFVKSQNPKYWVRDENVLDYRINEQLYTLLALK